MLIIYIISKLFARKINNSIYYLVFRFILRFWYWNWIQKIYAFVTIVIFNNDPVMISQTLRSGRYCIWQLPDESKPEIGPVGNEGFVMIDSCTLIVITLLFFKPVAKNMIDISKIDMSAIESLLKVPLPKAKKNMIRNNEPNK